MRAWPHQICLQALSGETGETTLEGRPLLSKAGAAAWLKNMYGQDFGEDFIQWKAWLRYNWQKVQPRAEPPLPDSKSKSMLRRPPR